MIEGDREIVKMLFHPIVKASKLILSGNDRLQKDPRSNSVPLGVTAAGCCWEVGDWLERKVK